MENHEPQVLQRKENALSPLSSPNKQFTKEAPEFLSKRRKYFIYAGVGVAAVSVVFASIHMHNVQSKNIETTSARSATAEEAKSTTYENPSDDQMRTMKSDLSLGGLDLGMDIDDMHRILGKEKTSTRKNNYIFYEYEGLEVGIKDGKIDALVSDDSWPKTKREIGEGDLLTRVLQVYGDNYTRISYDGKELYEYIFTSISGKKGVLRLAINPSSYRVSYVSVRIDPKLNSSAQDSAHTVSDNANDTTSAKRALINYYDALSDHHMREAYNLLSSNMQNHMGDYNTFFSGYQTTLSSKAGNIQVTSSATDKVVLSYQIVSRDRTGNNRIQVQNFDGTAIVQKQGDMWKIVDMHVVKTGEHMED